MDNNCFVITKNEDEYPKILGFKIVKKDKWENAIILM